MPDEPDESACAGRFKEAGREAGTRAAESISCAPTRVHARPEEPARQAESPSDKAFSASHSSLVVAVRNDCIAARCLAMYRNFVAAPAASSISNILAARGSSILTARELRPAARESCPASASASRSPQSSPVPAKPQRPSCAQATRDPASSTTPRIPVLPLDHHVLPEDAFKAESQPLRRPSRRRILRIALPLVAPVAQLFKDVSSHQIHRLGCRRSPLQSWRKHHIAYLDHAICRIHAHQARIAHRTAHRSRHNRKEPRPRQCLSRLLFRRQRLTSSAASLAYGPSAKPLPDLIVAIRPLSKALRHAFCARGERLQRHPSPSQSYRLRRARTGLPVLRHGIR